MTASEVALEVVRSRSEAAALTMPPLLVVEAIEEYLDAQSLGSGPVRWERIGEGQSNVTFLLERDGARVVLRRGPRPPYPPSAHNMVREARLLRALHAEGAPVPDVLAICETDDILGVPFYLMAFIDGVVITDTLPSWADTNDARRRVAHAAVDQLASLHSLDVSRGALATFGRPEGYLQRQVSLFTALWGKNTRREVPGFDRVSAWLSENLTETRRVSVVHGDYRIGNLMFAPDAPVRLAGVLDWEMATLGDPLADLGYFAAMYASPDRPATVMDLTPVTREDGFPGRDELVARYADAASADISLLRWYEGLALWKSAVFCEAMYSRWLDGERPGDTFAPRLEQGVPDLIAAAQHVIER